MRENLIPSRTGPKDLPTAQAPKKDILVVREDWNAKVGKDVCGNWPSHLFFCLPCLLPTFTVLCKSFFVCFGPDLMNREMSTPLHFVCVCVCVFFTMVRKVLPRIPLEATTHYLPAAGNSALPVHSTAFSPNLCPQVKRLVR